MFDSNKEQILETFKAKFVGRGVWNVLHTLTANVNNNDSIYTKKYLIILINEFFLIYCENIYCQSCRQHASEFISKYPIYNIFENNEIEDDKYPILYLEWLVKFHNHANNHAGHLEVIDIDVVIDYYIIGNNNEFIKNSDFEFINIENGMWHFFFLCSSKILKFNQISSFHYLILQFMKTLPYPQKYYFNEFIVKHKFTDALTHNDINESDLCIVFFEWIYELYSYINKKSNLNVFPFKLIKETYYTIDFCDNSCDK